MTSGEPAGLRNNPPQPSLSRRCSQQRKGIPDAESEPEPGSAESEPGAKARPAAGRRPETRPAAAGSEPPGRGSGSAGPAGSERPLVRNRMFEEQPVN